MIVTMECTDCKFAASYDAGQAVVCMHPDISPMAVTNFAPESTQQCPADALTCRGFKEGLPQELLYGDLTNVKAQYAEGTEESLTAWFWTLREYAERKKLKRA